MRFVLYFVQFGTAFMLFLFSSMASWYQGSALLSDPWEWKYSAKFTKLFYGADSFKDAGDISQLDFFVYAAKHTPATVVLMAVSLIYIAVLSSWLFIKRRNHRARAA